MASTPYNPYTPAGNTAFSSYAPAGITGYNSYGATGQPSYSSHASAGQLLQPSNQVGFASSNRQSSFSDNPAANSFFEQMQNNPAQDADIEKQHPNHEWMIEQPFFNCPAEWVDKPSGRSDLATVRYWFARKKAERDPRVLPYEERAMFMERQMSLCNVLGEAALRKTYNDWLHDPGNCEILPRNEEGNRSRKTAQAAKCKKAKKQGNPSLGGGRS